MPPKPKRKRGDDGSRSVESKATASAAAASTQETSTAGNNDSMFLFQLLTQLQKLSVEKTRCSELISALGAGKGLGDPKKEEHADSYWLFLATHTMAKLVSALDSMKQSDNATTEIAITLAVLCNLVATILLGDRSKLERSANAATASMATARFVRSALGRAIVCIAFGGTLSLQKLAEHKPKDPTVARRAMFLALTSLEMVVYLTPTKTPVTADNWHRAIQSLLDDASSLTLDDKSLKSFCSSAVGVLNLTDQEEACLALLVSAGAATASSTKRARRLKKDQTPNFSQTFEDILKDAIIFDGRVSIRRWASMAFVWLCQGQKRMLDVVTKLLQDGESWSRVLECPEHISAVGEPTSTRKKGKGTRSTRQQEPKRTTMIQVPGNVALVTLAARVLDVISESGGNCGARAPAGGMDTFAIALLHQSDSSKRRGKGQPMWSKPDLRNSAAIVIYHLIQRHSACIRENCHFGDGCKHLLLNEEASGKLSAVRCEDSTDGPAQYFPSLHKTLDSFCRAAASSVATGAAYINTSKSVKKLLALAACYTIASTVNGSETVLIDAKVFSFAMNQFVACLKVLLLDDDINENGDDPEDRAGNIAKDFSALAPLPEPSFPKATKSRKKKTEGDDCSFGSIFAPADDRSVPEEGLLKLYFRSVVKARNQKTGSPATDLFEVLLGAIDSCYETNVPVVAPQRSTRRRAASKSPQGKRKRRKTSETTEKVADDIEVSTVTQTRKLNSIRAGLASDIWNTLRCCVSLQASSRRSLQSYLRGSFTTEQICHVVRLSVSLDKLMTKSTGAREGGAEKDKKLSASFFASVGDYSVHERNLWTAHINFCQALGRGQVSFDPRKHMTSTKAILGDSRRRLAVFKQVVDACSPTKADGDVLWPLSLPGPVHALVTSNLVSEPISNSTEEPEVYLVESFIRSISHALEDSSLISVPASPSNLPGDSNKNEKTTQETFPLALRDGRLLLVAVSRLSTDSQHHHATALIERIHASCEDGSSLHKRVVDDPGVSQFLARALTVATTMLNMISVGESLREALFLQVGPAQYQLPRSHPLSEIAEGNGQPEKSWYKRERCFMGLFADWESPIIPDAVVPAQLHRLEGCMLKMVDVILQKTLEFGFEAAPKDNGQLLFSSWNSSGRRLSWDHRIFNKPHPIAFDTEAPLSSILMDLREDIGRLYHEVKGDSILVPDSLLTRIIKHHHQTRRRNGGPLRNRLGEMMSKAERTAEKLLDLTSKASEQVPLIVFAVFEAVAVYVAFIVSMNTKGSEGVFGRRMGTKKGRQRRRRRLQSGSGNDVEILSSAMSDDESRESDGEYNQQDGQDESRIDALARLHDACNAFGAAPHHPDWLDKSCCFQEGVTDESALNIAESALRTLTKLSKAANARYRIVVEEGLRTMTGEGSKDGTLDLGSVLQLCQLGSDDSNPAFKDAATRKGWVGSISNLSLVDEPSLVFHLYVMKHLTRRVALDAWLLNSSQRILGAIQEQNVAIEGWEASYSEYRACGEWELLFSDSLLGSCLDFSSELLDLETRASLEALRDGSQAFGRGLESLIVGERWRRVCESCVSHLMPASALLRFSLSRGVGRKSHPLSVTVLRTSEDVTILPSFFKEQLPESALGFSENGKLVLNRCISHLASLSFQNRGFSGLRLTCHAVSVNLLIDSRVFYDLVGMRMLATVFSLLFQIQSVFGYDEILQDTQATAFRVIVGKLVAMVESQAFAEEGSSILLSDGREHCDEKVLRLMVFLRSSKCFPVETVAQETTDILLSGRTDDAGDSCEEAEQSLGFKSVEQMVGMLAENFERYDGETTASITRILSALVELDFCRRGSDTTWGTILNIVASTLNSMNKEGLGWIAKLLQGRELASSQAKDVKNEIVVKLCILVAYAAAGGDKGSQKNDEGLAQLLRCLLASLDDVCQDHSGREHVLNLLFLLGCKYRMLNEIGESLISNSKGESTGYLVSVERLLHFVRDLNETLLKQGVTSSSGSKSKERRSKGRDQALDRTGEVAERNEGASKTGDMPRACSFVLKSGFHAQHWYNCYTCGLVFDKGCCTLCALTCHKGHEVAYSRYSSFFCDCGAEVASAGDQNRVICKCITPLSNEEASRIFSEEESKNYLVTKSATGPKDGSQRLQVDRLHETARRKVVNIAVGSLRPSVEASLEMMRAQAHSSWIPSLFKLLQGQSESSTLLSSFPEEKTGNYKLSLEYITMALCGRADRTLSMENHKYRPLVPVRAARAGTFNPRMSGDSTADRMKRAMLTRHGITRSTVTADSRGRLIIAEPCHLVFCSMLPVINTRYMNNALETQCSRAQMSVLGACSLKFNIVGMELCRENERHLVVWGTSEACIVVLGKKCNGVEQTITLSFDLDPHESETDFLLKCMWIPGSQTSLAVVCGTFVRIYDMKHLQEESASALVCYSIAYEAVIRDVAAVSFPRATVKYPHHSPARKLKLYLLLDTGRLFDVTVQLDSEGEIEERGTVFLEQSSKGIEIPSSALQFYDGVDVGSEGSAARNVGEGSSLTYLHFGGLLLYKCASSSVLAISLDVKGHTRSTFEFLPNLISSEVLGTGQDGYGITGPFSHWTELGLVSGKGYFRVVCVGKSTRTSQPKLLCVDYNDRHIKVSEMRWVVGGSVGLGLSLSTSFEGVTAFSAPYYVGSHPHAQRSGSFVERVHVCAITSNGSMLIYGENMSGENLESKSSTPSLQDVAAAGGEKNANKDLTPAPRESEGEGPENQGTKAGTKPEFPLSFFEKLVNVSDSEELEYGGDAVGSDSSSIKAKLSAKNSVYMMSPSREGCTITVWLDHHKQGEEGTSDFRRSSKRAEASRTKESHVIVAIRVLVGSSTPDCIPRQLFIEGRPFSLTAETKRWYDLPLTAEEVVLALRNGFVTVGIGPSFDSASNPLIDAIEVYAAHRCKVAELIPRCREHKKAKTEPKGILASSKQHGPPNNEGLLLCTKALSHLYQVLGVRLRNFKAESQTLQRLIQQTALDNQSGLRAGVVNLLERVEPDESVRQSFLDEGTVHGLHEALKLAEGRFAEKDGADAVGSETHYDRIEHWRAISDILRKCLDLSAKIALSRPENYTKSTEKMVSAGLSKSSMGVGVCDLFLVALDEGVASCDLVQPIVRLILTEMGVSRCSFAKNKEIYASFSSLEKLLTDTDAVERCCDAIASFLDVHGGAMPSVIPVAQIFSAGHADRNELSAPIAYQCDSCELFPITDSRLTLLEGDHDIDLCKKCYQLGRVYAERLGFDPDTPVVINGRTVGASSKLSCAQISQMQPVPIANVEQVEQALQEEGGSLHRAIRLSRQELGGRSTGKRFFDSERLTDLVFADTLRLTEKMLEKCAVDNSVRDVNHLLNLLLGLVKAGGDSRRIDRAKKFAVMAIKISSNLIGTIHSTVELDDRSLSKILLTNLYRSLSRLFGGEASISAATDDNSLAQGNSPSKSKEKEEGTRYVCDHGVPAARKRCASGANKNRRFYSCGMERKQRCRFFKWANHSEGESEQKPPSKYCAELANLCWDLMTRAVGESSTSGRLCDLLETELAELAELTKSEVYTPPEVKSIQSVDSSLAGKQIVISSLYDSEAFAEDVREGVFCSRKKLRVYTSQDSSDEDTATKTKSSFVDEEICSGLTEKVIESSLDLISLVASSSSDTVQDPTRDSAKWFSLLCEIISMSPMFQAQAKGALKRLCGGNNSLYHSVRDHYVFGFQFRNLLRAAQTCLEGARCVTERARQCGDAWNGEEFLWGTMHAGSLLGTQDLISEDCMTLDDNKRISVIVEELVSVSKSRGENWRQFCGMSALPVPDRRAVGAVKRDRRKTDDVPLAKFPPVMTLFWVACTIPSPNQASCMKLVDVALSSAPTKSNASGVPSDGNETSKEETEEAMAPEAAGEIECVEQVLPFSTTDGLPEDILVIDEGGLKEEDVYAFIMQFVLRGRTAELRKVSGQVAFKVCGKLSSECFGRLYKRMIGAPLGEIASLGCASLQYLQLLQSLLRSPSFKSSLQLPGIAENLISCFIVQMYSFKACMPKGTGPLTFELGGQGKEVVKKRFDLSTCVHCHRVVPGGRSHGQSKGSQRSSSRTQKASARSIGNNEQGTSQPKEEAPKWLPEQVRPFAKGRLDASTDASVSTEFAMFVQLKCRLAISEIHLTINDPRGRFVKSIAVSYTPRQVTDVNRLKTEDYSRLWQRCATLSLARGATRASCTLPVPVTAANLRLEYVQFYERPGGSRAADGSLILHCPRCTRVVNNAHGVCGNCGEVAFQCRKCRHINYDRLDAFLCVECGYCSSGGFSYDLTAGVASNAVAIIDDDCFERSLKVLRVASKLHDELKSALIERYRSSSKKRSRSQDPDAFASYGLAMKRALLGELPDFGGGTDDQTSSANRESTTVGTISSGRNEQGARSSSAANRARSLLRLARQLRGDSSQRSRSRENLVREAFFGSSRELSIDDMDDPESEIIGIINSAEASGRSALSEPGDPLSRLVASIYARGRDRDGETPNDQNRASTGAADGRGRSTSGKSSLEECERLYQLMHEAERECFELQRRINAWTRLENDCLLETGASSEEDAASLAPTMCSKCAGSITLHLLILAMRLFQTNMGQVESVISKDFIRALFLEPPNMQKDLFELKRLAITTLATKSEKGGKLILEELRSRLRASNDPASAGILGKLLETEFPLAEQFVALAASMLEGEL